MSRKGKTLHLFTAKFPFGNKSETFLETEINYLSKVFDKIIIYPSSKENTRRELPGNFRVNELFCSKSSSKKEKLKLIFLNFITVLKLLSNHSKSKGSKTVFKHRKILLDIISVQLLKLESFKREIGFNSEDVYYDYWFENSTLMLALARKKQLIGSAISRAHGFDIYDERWGEIGVPFRNFKLANLDKVFIISDFGKKYMIRQSSSLYKSKLHVARLGVEKITRSESLKTNSSLTIISCSSIVDFKQVEKIPTLLKHLDMPIHWIHFGDGPFRSEVEKEIKTLPPNISVEMKGHIDNSELINFYKENHVDLFITLSTSEGLPVSMMEAQSFGIPIVAYPVGGIPEIVINALTGFLLSSDSTIEEQTKQLKDSLDFKYSTEKIDNFFSEHFDAAVNYSIFTEKLCS